MNFTAKDIARMAEERRTHRLAKEETDRYTQEQFVLALMLDALVTNSCPNGGTDKKYWAEMKHNALRIFKNNEARLIELLQQAVPDIEVSEINIYDFATTEGRIFFGVKGTIVNV